MMEIFVKTLTYSCAVAVPLLAILGILYFCIKFGVSALFQTLVDKADYAFDKIVENLKGMFDFVVSEILKIATFITDKAAEISTLINVYLIYQHPPQGDIQYAVFCVYLAINTVVLLKKGNIDLNKIVGDLKDVAMSKTSVKETTIEQHKVEKQSYEEK